VLLLVLVVVEVVVVTQVLQSVGHRAEYHACVAFAEHRASASTPHRDGAVRDRSFAEMAQPEWS
jgi:hypothetical protein